MIQTIQKIIKVGSSDGITLPAKQLKREGIARGDEVKVTIERASQNHDKLMDEYQEFVAQYSTTLKNLADR